MTERAKDQPFDERAALAELERFRNEIERYRRQRQAVNQEFDEFVSSFPSPESLFPSETAATTPTKRDEPAASSSGRALVSPAPPRPVSPPPVPEAPKAAASPGAPSPRADVRVPVDTAPLPSTATAKPASSPVVPTVQAASRIDVGPSARVGEKPGGKRWRVAVVTLLLLLAAAGAVWIWNARRAGQGQEVSAPAATVQQPAAPVPPPETTTPPAPATESVVTTVRAAWVRVIADGERVVERELPSEARVPFKAEKTIVIRTGDAGAVRLSIRGEDQGALGRDGQVVTRTFTVPGKTPR